jgi:pimeloyl-ACP methyl ester carboxylesterase
LDVIPDRAGEYLIMAVRQENGTQMSGPAEWRLSRTFDSADGTVAYEVLGDGSPVVLVHGTPSYLWRNVAGELAARFTVYVCDLLGYGTSEQRDGQDVSIAAQTRMLAGLLDAWGLQEPCIAGHDFGATITLRLMLLHGRRFRRVALCDAVAIAIAPWISPFSRHVQRYLEAFQTVPEHIHRQMIAAHLRTAIAREMTDAELEPYLRPWLGPAGQAAYYRQVAQFDERYTREIEPRYGEIGAPALVLWGQQDGWLAPASGRRLADAIPGARLVSIPDAGHFLPEDQPGPLADALARHFASG